jgi:hypothetical protein
MKDRPGVEFRGVNIIAPCPYCGGRLQLCDGWLAHLDPQCEGFDTHTPQEIAEAWAARVSLE